MPYISTPPSSRSPLPSPSSSPNPFDQAPSPASSCTSISENDLGDALLSLSIDSLPLETRDYILVIGGLGFIGSHTTLELLKDGYNVVVVDNMSNSFESAFTNIHLLAKKHHVSRGTVCPDFKLHKLDYRSPTLRTVLAQYAVQDPAAFPGTPRASYITGVIHFAAYKSVSESTSQPLAYYLNNVAGLIELLALLSDFNIKNFVFSSSATVYGSALTSSHFLVTEDQLVHHETASITPGITLTPGIKGLTSPYGRTKYFSEAILADVALADPSWRITALRYFNPVGCEPSGLLAEDPRQTPTNLFPVVCQVLTGSRAALDVFGTDWDTRDGTAVRDYIHVVDLARGHLAALAAAGKRKGAEAFRAYNLGTGTGSTVKEVVACMERAAGKRIRTNLAPRRVGDVAFCVADVGRAERELGWKTRLGLEDCARDTWMCLRLAGKVDG